MVEVIYEFQIFWPIKHFNIACEIKIKPHLMHRIHSSNNKNVHNIVGVQIVVQTARKPLFRDVHRTNSSTKHGNAVLEKGNMKQLDGA